MVSKSVELLRGVQAFHQRQRATHRRVYRLNDSGFLFTAGQAATTAGTAFAGMSAASSGLPFWMFVGMVLGGFFGGKYLFPVPDNSVASPRGPREVRRLSAGELDALAPDDIRAYEDNLMLLLHLQDANGLGTREALQRQREAVTSAAHVSGTSTSTLAGLPLTEAQSFSATAARHDVLKQRWVAYELDPQLQVDYPAMTDVAYPETAAMIKAMRRSNESRGMSNALEYRAAVEEFALAITAAERAAGVPGK